MTIGSTNSTYLAKNATFEEFTAENITDSEETLLGLNVTDFSLGNKTITQGNAVFSTTSNYIELGATAYTQWLTKILEVEPTLNCESRSYCTSDNITCSELNSTLPRITLNLTADY